MQKKLIDFYSGMIVNYSIFSIVSKGNQNLLKKENLVQTPSYSLKGLNEVEEYILTFIDERKEIVIGLFEAMKKYQFDNVPSVGSNFRSFGAESGRYTILSNVNLYEHTLNVAVQTVEMLSVRGTPKDWIAISLIIAILHDFGKSPIIKSHYREEGERGHHKISANFSKDYLINFVKKNKKSKINSNLIDTIYGVLVQHHDVDIDRNNAFLTCLIEADRKARDKELLNYRVRENNNKGIL